MEGIKQEITEPKSDRYLGAQHLALFARALVHFTIKFPRALKAPHAAAALASISSDGVSEWKNSQ